jgi:DNA-binding transcriptional regulator LsrR (DeoR family)
MRELSERDILKICYLYYQEEKTQEEISGLFGVSRFKISRTLKEAKRKGYVTITINDPKGDFAETEVALADKFGLEQGRQLSCFGCNLGPHGLPCGDPPKTD